MVARLVLREDVTRDAVDDAAARAGWQLSNVLPASERQPAQIIFSAASGYVYVVDELRLGVMYLQIASDAPAALMAEARALLSCHDDDDYAALFAQGDAAAGLAVAALQGDEDAARVAQLSRALDDERPEIRALALAAASYALWPGLRPALSQMASDEALAPLRQAASQLLAAIAEAP
jgi:hypothetical protein